MFMQIAISFSTADLDFAKKIGEMLEQLSYIDDCDTLSQSGYIQCNNPPPPGSKLPFPFGYSF